MQWRLIPRIAAPGSVQMEIDLWLLEQHRQGFHPPTLRFYTWDPAAISVGYHQRHGFQAWDNIDWKGAPIDVIRRPTGGRAVLHQGDLTYAVITSGIVGSRVQVYQEICEFLIQGWRAIGVELEYGQAGRGYIHNPNCFGTATGADLVMADGAKLIGSAQLRRGNAILQHGSMQLEPDPTLFQRVFGVAPVLPHLPVPPTSLIDTAISALVKSASQCFAAEFQVQSLSATEWQEIASLSHLLPGLKKDTRQS